VEKITNSLCKGNYGTITNKALLWDTVKCEIRTITVSHACFRAKQKHAVEKNIMDRLEYLEARISLGELNHIEEQDSLKRELEDIHIEQGRGAMIRSRADLIDCDEKCSKYFLNLEKRNYKTKYIKSLLNADGKEITEPNDILREEESFYKNLYQTRNTPLEHTLNDCSFIQDSKHLSQGDKEKSDKDKTVEELGKNLRMLPNNKSPGCDGLTAEFYKFFWKDIKNMLFDSFIYSFHSGILSLDQRRAILSLIPKANKDLRHLKNWRPLSLLNTDYKILAKTLATRLQSVVGNIIHADQSGYIKGRFIGENIRTIIDTLQFTSTFDVSGYMIFLDFEKAFDSISWQFLFKALEASNFGDRFIKWIKILYNEPLLCVTNNGYASQFFPIGRGIRQGCPISALLFLLVVESLAVKIRQSPDIFGINVKGCKVVISQLADDTTLFLKDKASIKNSLQLLAHFEKCAGLKLNKEKSEAIVLGKDVKEFSSICGIHIAINPIKTLGIWITKETYAIPEINFKERIEKLRNLLNMWKQRKLSLKGKVTIINCLALPQVMYVASVLYVPAEIISEVNKIIFSLLWPKKVHVKRTTVIAPILGGGLRMPDFECKVKACKVMWAKRLQYTTKNSIFAEVFGLPVCFKDMFFFNYDVNYLQNYTSLFYKQVLKSWYEVHSRSFSKCN
jgi:hypothetical protein